MSYRGRGSFGGYWGGYSPQPSSEFDVYGQYHSVNNLYGLSAFPPFPETLITDSGSSHGLPRITLGCLLYSHSFSFGLHPWSCVKSSLSPTPVVRIPNLHFSCINSCFKIIAYSWVLTNDSLTDYTFELHKIWPWEARCTSAWRMKVHVHLGISYPGAFPTVTKLSNK